MATRKIVTKYKWEIDGFSQKIATVQNGAPISSDVFSLNDNSKEKFSIKLERSNSNYCALHLGCNDFGRKNEVKLSAKNFFENAAGVIDNGAEKKLSLNRGSNTDIVNRIG